MQILQSIERDDSGMASRWLRWVHDVQWKAFRRPGQSRELAKAKQNHEARPKAEGRHGDGVEKERVRTKQAVILGASTAKERSASEKRLNELFDDGWKIARFEALGQSFFATLVRGSTNSTHGYQAQRNH